MDTWGRRGFAAAVITGGMLGLSGAGADAPAERWGAAPEPDRRLTRRPPVNPAMGATRYGTPEYRTQPRAAEYRLPEAAEQTMASPVQPDPSSARHATPAYPVAPVDRGYPTGGLPRFAGNAAPNGSGTHGADLNGLGADTVGMNGVSASGNGTARPDTVGANGFGGYGSDGFLAGNLAALPAPPATALPGTPIGALGPAEGSLGTGFDTYGSAAPGPQFGRNESRHARPEQRESYPERLPAGYAERPAEQYAERPAGGYAERSPELYAERPAADLYAERPADVYRDRGGERCSDHPAERYNERPAEQYAERPAELYAERPGDRYAERSVGGDTGTVRVSAVAPGGPADQPTNYLGQPVSYLAEQPVRSVELVGAAYQAGGHRAGPPVNQHAQPVDADTSALGSLDSSALFGSLSRRPR